MVALGGLLIFIVLAVAVGGAFGGWVFTPKGDNQLVIRTSIVLTFVCCYLMWAIVYLAQLNPLVAPKKADFAEESFARY